MNSGEPQAVITEYWEKEVCGTRFSTSTDVAVQSREISEARYAAEPFIADFAGFDTSAGDRVLEIGVGAGSDFLCWLRTGASCSGIDITMAAIDLTRSRIEIENAPRPEQLCVGSGSDLPFEDNTFDVVYSYGVIHHAADTTGCLREIALVLKPGGVTRLMVYSDFSATGIMLWLLYGLGRLRPRTSQRDLMAKYLESPGTKSFRSDEFEDMLSAVGLRTTSVCKRAGSGDLLLMPPSAKYARFRRMYLVVQRIYPRRTVKRFERYLGCGLLVEAVKP